MDINTPQGLSRFFSQFGGQRGETKKILLLEVLPTQIDPPRAYTTAERGQALKRTELPSLKM